MRRFTTISEFHAFVQLPPPQHPLLSVVDVGNLPHREGEEPTSMAFDFYSIAVKRLRNAQVHYGQHSFDFNEGIMSFMAPNQMFSLAAAHPAEAVKKSGWVVYIHPDFIWNTPLAKTIQQYDLWDYALKESLFLSAQEEATILTITRVIEQEYTSTIDRFSKPIIVSHVESLLQYADRFYHRQFLTREKANHAVLERVETLLQDYFKSDHLPERGLPTVHYVADCLQLSPKYLSNLLRVVTGQTTQQHIHAWLIAKAKKKLSATTLTVSEITYQLGVEHVSSFSKLFKAKTHLTPLEFRASFN